MEKTILNKARFRLSSEWYSSGHWSKFYIAYYGLKKPLTKNRVPKLVLTEQLFSKYLSNLYFFRNRTAKHAWWLKLRPLLRILAKHVSAYEDENLYLTYSSQPYGQQFEGVFTQDFESIL